jgi:hypothetical protein
VRVNPIVESELFGCRRVLEPRTDHCLETGLSCGTTLRTDLDPPAVPGNVSGEPILNVPKSVQDGIISEGLWSNRDAALVVRAS